MTTSHLSQPSSHNASNRPFCYSLVPQNTPTRLNISRAHEQVVFEATFANGRSGVQIGCPAPIVVKIQIPITGELTEQRSFDLEGTKAPVVREEPDDIYLLEGDSLQKHDPVQTPTDLTYAMIHGLLARIEEDWAADVQGGEGVDPLESFVDITELRSRVFGLTVGKVPTINGEQVFRQVKGVRIDFPGAPKSAQPARELVASIS